LDAEIVTVARQRLGTAGEDAAAEQLSRQGWKLIARNARTRYGELDLIALDGSTLVFAEVKTLRSGPASRSIEALAAIGPRKQRQVRRLARAWLADADLPLRFSEIRFDAIGVAIGTGPPAIEHVRAAF
jgi:putative endonuclease